MDFDSAWGRICSITGWKNYGQLAQFLDITSSSVSGAKKRGIMPLDWVAKVAQKYECSLDLLVFGRDEAWASAVAEMPAFWCADRKDLEKEYVLVPRYNVQVSAGGGALVESEQVVDHLAFKGEWIRSTMHLQPSDLVLITAMGDSMYPTIRQGDLLLLDKSQQEVRDDAIYVLRLNGGLIAKRLQKLFDGSIQIKSDNRVYDPQTVPMDRVGELTIIGRVVWIGGRV